MWVIAAKTLHFRKGTLEENPKTGEKFFAQTDSFTLVPNWEHPQTPVQAPDWIKDDDLYKLVKKENRPNAMVLQETTEGPPETEKEKEEEKGAGLKAHPGFKK